VQDDPLGREAAAQRAGQLAARRDVAADPLLGEDPVDRRARERLGGEVDLEVHVVGAEGVDEGPGAGPQVVLHHDVRRRAELAGEVDGVAPPELQAAARVELRAEREGR
jgi:hypothetical protein